MYKYKICRLIIKINYNYIIFIFMVIVNIISTWSIEALRKEKLNIGKHNSMRRSIVATKFPSFVHAWVWSVNLRSVKLEAHWVLLCLKYCCWCSMCLYFGYQVIYYSLKLSIKILSVTAAFNFFLLFCC